MLIVRPQIEVNDSNVYFICINHFPFWVNKMINNIWSMKTNQTHEPNKLMGIFYYLDRNKYCPKSMVCGILN